MLYIANNSKLNLISYFLISLTINTVRVNGEFVTTITSYEAGLPSLPALTQALFTPIVPTAVNPNIHSYGSKVANDSFFIICGSFIASFTTVCILAFLFQYLRDRRAVNKQLDDEEFAGLYNTVTSVEKNINEKNNYVDGSDGEYYKENKLYHYYKEIKWEDSDTDKEDYSIEINNDDTDTIADEKELQAISRQIYQPSRTNSILLSTSDKSLVDSLYAPIGKKLTFNQEDPHFAQLESKKRNSRTLMYVSPLTEIMATKQKDIDYEQQALVGNDQTNRVTSYVPTPTTPLFDFKSPVRSEFRMTRDQANKLSALHLEKKELPTVVRPPSQLLEEMFDSDTIVHDNNDSAKIVDEPTVKQNEDFKEHNIISKRVSVNSVIYSINGISAATYEPKKVSDSEEKRRRISSVILQDKRSSYQQAISVSNNIKFNPNHSNIYIQSV